MSSAINPKHQCRFYDTIKHPGKFVAKLKFWQPGRWELVRCTLRHNHPTPLPVHPYFDNDPEAEGKYDHYHQRADGTVHVWKMPVYDYDPYKDHPDRERIT
jgi:hypothetical protein